MFAQSFLSLSVQLTDSHFEVGVTGHIRDGSAVIQVEVGNEHEVHRG